MCGKKHEDYFSRKCQSVLRTTTRSSPSTNSRDRSRAAAEIEAVRQGKFFVLDLNGLSEDAARKKVEQIAREVLTNPVIEEFRFELLK